MPAFQTAVTKAGKRLQGNARKLFISHPKYAHDTDQRVNREPINSFLDGVCVPARPMKSGLGSVTLTVGLQGRGWGGGVGVT